MFMLQGYLTVDILTNRQTDLVVYIVLNTHQLN